MFEVNQERYADAIYS